MHITRFIFMVIALLVTIFAGPINEEDIREPTKINVFIDDTFPTESQRERILSVSKTMDRHGEIVSNITESDVVISSMYDSDSTMFGFSEIVAMFPNCIWDTRDDKFTKTDNDSFGFYSYDIKKIIQTLAKEPQNAYEYSGYIEIEGITETELFKTIPKKLQLAIPPKSYPYYNDVIASIAYAIADGNLNESNKEYVLNRLDYVVGNAYTIPDVAKWTTNGFTDDYIALIPEHEALYRSIGDDRIIYWSIDPIVIPFYYSINNNLSIDDNKRNMIDTGMKEIRLSDKLLSKVGLHNESIQDINDKVSYAKAKSNPDVLSSDIIQFYGLN